MSRQRKTKRKRVQFCRTAQKSCRILSNWCGETVAVRGTFFFDAKVLVVAKVASYLKESLGTRISVLSKLMEVLSKYQDRLKTENPEI